MCASAIEQSRIKRIITGAVNKNNETARISEDILAGKEWKREVKNTECTEIINNFFKNKR
jgi:tRNA(Arg) A34 adenosine deaminase TadA